MPGTWSNTGDVLEYDSAFSDFIDDGADFSRVSIGPEVIAAQGVDDEYDDVGRGASDPSLAALRFGRDLDGRAFRFFDLGPATDRKQTDEEQ